VLRVGLLQQVAVGVCGRIPVRGAFPRPQPAEQKDGGKYASVQLQGGALG